MSSELILPKWYLSTQGPAISKTIWNISGSMLPVVNLVLGGWDIHIVSAQIDPIISSLVFLYFVGQAVWGYLRAKKKIVELQGEVGRLGAERTAYAAARKEPSPE